MKRTSFFSGELQIQANDLGNELDVIQTGLVGVSAGAVGFREVALMTGARRTTHVIALSPTQVVVLGCQAMAHLTQHHPTIAAKVFTPSGPLDG
ncbi:MAG: hypothetical protein RMI89_00070 [Gloeomargarita sp. SKYBB_i_bin120]|nr:hypothetical protein [Gloeomargarita sp. SKYG98]MCS7291359.1 hypothetical protein [Gloeomargarita sp. SKYB120]MDW8176918.1 hypothetical protein [Gloeomargarita sp. SKYBB_i_bin120]